MQRGLRVIAGGAFIARHSFSSSKSGVAEGRPNNQDIETARAFGLAVKDKIEGSGMELPLLPGSLSLAARIVPPDGERLVTYQPLADGNCLSCGKCVGACPTGAIEPSTLVIQESLCLRCQNTKV